MIISMKYSKSVISIFKIFLKITINENSLFIHLLIFTNESENNKNKIKLEIKREIYSNMWESIEGIIILNT